MARIVMGKDGATGCEPSIDWAVVDPHNSEFEAEMRVARLQMEKWRNALRELAK